VDHGRLGHDVVDHVPPFDESVDESPLCFGQRRTERFVVPFGVSSVSYDAVAVLFRKVAGCEQVDWHLVCRRRDFQNLGEIRRH